MKTASRILACLACAALAALAVSCARPASKWNDGVYAGKAEGVHGDIELSVTVEKGKIAKVEVTKQQEAAGVSDVAFERIPRAIIEKQTTKVDAVSGASLSSKAIMAAAEDALSKAVKQ
jgi:uncharacterized protein with FMN-binding domain